MPPQSKLTFALSLALVGAISEPVLTLLLHLVALSPAIYGMTAFLLLGTCHKRIWCQSFVTEKERERERRLSSRSITTVPAIKTIYIPYYAPLPHSARLPPFSPLPPALLDIGDDVIGPKEHWSGVKTRSVLTWLWWRIWLYSCGFAWFWLVRWGVVNILPRSFSIRSVSWALVVILISRSIRLP